MEPQNAYAIEGYQTDHWDAICTTRLMGLKKTIELFDAFLRRPRWRGKYRLRNMDNNEIIKEGKRKP